MGFADYRLSIDSHGHRIDVRASRWTGFETVSCDGVVVSQKRSMFYLTPHMLTLVDDGVSVVYELDILTGWGFNLGYILRRNGLIVACSP